MKKLLSKKDDGGKEIIVEVGLAVISVALLIIFRKAIADLVTNIITEAEGKIKELFDATTIQ